MNRQSFMQKLENLLKKMPDEHRQEAIDFYQEYFDEAGTENEAKVIEELKSPEHLAAKILAEYAQKQLITNKTSENKKSKRKASGRISAFWFGVLAVLSAPITFPLAIALLSVLFGLAIVVLVLVPTMAIVAFALLIAFVFSIFVLPIQALYILAWLIILVGFIKLFLALTKAGLDKIFIRIKSL